MMRTPARSGSATIASVAARPSVPGMRMSMSTTSGAGLADEPRRPRRRRPPRRRPRGRRRASISTRKPARSRAWSSASTTRIVIGSGSGVKGRCTATRNRSVPRRPGVDGAAARGHPLVHADQPEPAAGGVGRAGRQVVLDDQVDGRRGAGELEPGPAVAVALGVGEGLLDDAVGAASWHGRRARRAGVAGACGCRPGARRRRTRRSARRDRRARGPAAVGAVCAVAGSPSSPGSRRTWSRPPSSSSTVEAEARTDSSDSSAWSGSVRSSTLAAADCTVITAMRWATTSWRSRAMRRRSSTTWRRASSSRAASARRARSATSAT